ncbi:cell division protein FtsL [Shimia thalassica]|uniref:cell division protein FtsL n=1 Tax=Shimia thalassica TaxID=1715693 RepID=UPI0026E46B4A|nr:cell division protein FtsL [Shimia thalassica]MDO6482525.1 cell division protein FtsL [Shimia thalassica]
MRSIVLLMTALAVIGLAVWAYRENYRTQNMIGQTAQVQREIGAARERLSVLRAEWAYLNRPDRLRDLAELNFDSLQLLPLRPDQFGKVDQVTYPPLDSDLEIDGIVDVSSAESYP